MLALEEWLDSVRITVQAADAIMSEQHKDPPTVFLDLLDRVKRALLAVTERLDDVDDAGNPLHPNQTEVARIRELANSLQRVYPLIAEESWSLWSGSLAPGTPWGCMHARIKNKPDATTTMLSWAGWFVDAHRFQVIPMREEYRRVAYVEAYRVVLRVLEEFS